MHAPFVDMYENIRPHEGLFAPELLSNSPSIYRVHTSK